MTSGYVLTLIFCEFGFQAYYCRPTFSGPSLRHVQCRKFMVNIDKAPRLSISIVIWILSSDTDTICQLNQFNTNSEAALLSTSPWHCQIICFS